MWGQNCADRPGNGGNFPMAPSDWRRTRLMILGFETFDLVGKTNAVEDLDLLTKGRHYQSLDQLNSLALPIEDDRACFSSSQ